MWKIGGGDPLAKQVYVNIPRAALTAIYDECDGFDVDETGGRLIGTFHKAAKGRLQITVSGIIEPGPNAKRSTTSFFQDGKYQEAVFRRIEDIHREIEHLGNWHTHHVNGYPTLSSGDRTTYHRIVNHENHNIDFFYALLVTAKNNAGAEERYQVRHFIVLRGQSGEFEIPANNITVTNDRVLWPQAAETVSTTEEVTDRDLERQRVKDRDYFEDFHPEFSPFKSKSTGGLYWKGRLELVDDRVAQVAIAETGDSTSDRYAVVIKVDGEDLIDIAQEIAAMQFPSARAGLRKIEGRLNRAIYKTRSSR